MGLIKRADLEQYTRNACVMDLSDLEKRGSALVDAANAKAAEIIRDAQKQREQLLGNAREEGHRLGFEEGKAEGLEKGRAEGVEEARTRHAQVIDELTKLWAEQLELFERRREELLESARVQVVELAAAIAARVVRRSIELDPSVVTRELESVLSAVTEPTRLVISVHPDDAERTRAELPTLIDRFASCEHAQVVTDPSLPRGSCIARTPSGGVLDASIGVQLDRITQALLPSGHEPKLPLGLSDAEPEARDQGGSRVDHPEAQDDAA